MIRGVTIDNIEAFSNYPEALKRLDIQLLAANYKKLRAEKNGNIWTFYKKGKSFGYVTDNKPVYELNIDEIRRVDRQALQVVYFDSENLTYEPKITATLKEYVYICIPEQDKDSTRFKLKTSDIKFGRIVEIYGVNEEYPLTVIEVDDNGEKKYISGIPTILTFKNVEDMVEICRKTPEDGYQDLDDYFKKAFDLIKYTHELWFGFGHKSLSTWDRVEGYHSSKYVYSYDIRYTTDGMQAVTETVPTAINLNTREIYDSLTELRADSILRINDIETISISKNNEKIGIIREKIKSAFEIYTVEEAMEWK